MDKLDELKKDKYELEIKILDLLSEFMHKHQQYNLDIEYYKRFEDINGRQIPVQSQVNITIKI